MPDIRSIEPLRRRICSIIDIGTADDFISRAYTFDGAEARCGGLLLDIEAATVAFFAADCALRIWTFPGRPSSS